MMQYLSAFFAAMWISTAISGITCVILALSSISPIPIAHSAKGTDSSNLIPRLPPSLLSPRSRISPRCFPVHQQLILARLAEVKRWCRSALETIGELRDLQPQRGRATVRSPIPPADAMLLWRMNFGVEGNWPRAYVAERFRQVEHEADRSPGPHRGPGPLIPPFRNLGRLVIDCEESPAARDVCGAGVITAIQPDQRHRRIILVRCCSCNTLSVVFKGHT